MDRGKLDTWFKERGIVLEEDFATAFIRYAKAYKKKQFAHFGGRVRPFGR